MDSYIGLFIGGLILFSTEVYVWSKFYNEKISLRNLWVYFSIVFLTFLSILNKLFVNAFVSVLVVSILIYFCNWLIFRKKFNEIFVMIVYGQILVFFADVLGTILLTLIYNKDAIFVKNNFFNTFIANVLVSLVYVLLCSIPITKKIYMKIVDLTSKVKFINLIYICVLLIVSINFLVAIIYYDMKSIYVIIINSLLLIIYSFIIYKAMDEKNINTMMKAENESLMQSLNEYESMVDRQRVDNHENKNQLLIIKNMIKKNDKDVVKYIDTIVKDEKEDDEALYTKVKTIPTGGLQGIIYQKMLTMKDESILFSLDVSRDVRKIDLSNFSMEDNYKLCKIVGVFLDNSIQESKNLDEKIIMISLYVDENMFVIDISNRFKSVVDVDKIDDEGYTTKGEGHGYGLSLVKKIVDESKEKFINDRKVTKDIFKQVIKVKIK